MAERQPDLSFYVDIIRSLEAINAPYMLIGAFAASAYGSTRITFDVDILVDLEESHIQALAQRYQPPRYYADPAQMRDSIRLGLMFNIIDTTRGEKVDLIPLTMEPRYRQAFSRRVRQTFEEPSGLRFEAWSACPEDIIVGKLMAWAEGRSEKHEHDIRSMLVFVYLGVDQAASEAFDFGYVDQWAQALGEAVADVWETLKVAARLEAERGRQK